MKLAFIYLLILTTFLSCVGGADTQTASCASGEAFDEVSRTCQTLPAGAGLDVIIEPTLSSVEFDEDSGFNQVDLDYNVGTGGLPLSCRVLSGADGLLKNKTLNGIVFSSKTNDPSAQRISITFADSGALNVSTNTTSTRNILIDINAGVTTTSQINTAILSNATASSWVNTAIIAAVSTTATAQTLIDSIDCFCSGGVCRATLIPADNYHGLTNFTYYLSDSIGESAGRIVSTTVNSINDNPTATTGSFTIDEDYSPVFVVPSLNLASVADMDAAVVISDANDGDPSGLLLSYELVTAPLSGTLLSFDSNGNFEYDPNDNFNGTDSFVYKVRDLAGGESLDQTISITVNAIDDAPTGSNSTLAAIDEDSIPVFNPTSLNYTDVESDIATTCSITSLIKVFISAPCSCVAGACSVGISPLPNESGLAGFQYTVTAGGVTSANITTTFIVNSVNDAPFAHNILDAASLNRDLSAGSEGVFRFLESDTHIPELKNFTLKAAEDIEGSFLSYSLKTAPVLGSLQNCIGLDGSSSTDLDCDYTPFDGNSNDNGVVFAQAIHTFGTVPNGEIILTARSYGSFGDDISLELVAAYNFVGGDEVISVDGKNIKILIAEGISSASDIISLINADSKASSLVVASLGTAGTMTALASDTLSSGAGGNGNVDTFEITVTDGAASSDTLLNIRIDAVDDRPVICDYSSFNEASECGVNGCIGSTTPVGNIFPKASNLYYYNLAAGSCWKSDISLTNQWSPVESHIRDQEVNEREEVIIDNIIVDEGGSDTGENSQEIRIVSIDIEDESLIPAGNVKFYYNDTLIGDASSLPGTPVDFNDGISSSDLNSFRLNITPQSPLTGSSNIDITFCDYDGASCINNVKVGFNLTVNSGSATHNGWRNIVALGVKTDKFGNMLESNMACSHSRTYCDSGNNCTGANNPTSVVSPDNEDAIYWDSLNDTCYHVGRTEIQEVDYISRTSTPVTISYVDSVIAGSETVSVIDNDIVIGIQRFVTTTDQIISAIESDVDANELVKVWNRQNGKTQDEESLIIVQGVTNTNWREFETHCNITTTEVESACSVLGEACIGDEVPSFSATKESSFYYDINSNKCYRSVATGTGASDWEEYLSTVNVKLAWENFSALGGASISGFNVFRREASESFDYTSPINKETIASGLSEFSDNGINSFLGPVEKTAYYYEVRPIINGIASDTNEDDFKTLRVLTPPQNMAFVHRWAVNRAVCEQLGESADSSSNFRCSYEGPGDSGNVPGSNFYDIGSDLLVDRFEAGCHYSAAPACGQSTTGSENTSDGSCVGAGAPDGATFSDAGDIYYDRSSGRCYENTSGTSGTTWTQVDGASSIANYNSARIPPLVFMNQTDSNSFCSSQVDISASSGYRGMNGSFFSNTGRLPTRKEQVAYSRWDASASDSDIINFERGLSLNLISRCNSSSADGLASFYTDSEVPDSSSFFTLPGTDSSGIRSLITGSDETSLCLSQFGLQDVVGNVSEWTSENITCDATGTTCTGDTSAFAVGNGSDAFANWDMDGLTGPCFDTDADGICDTALPELIFENEDFSLGHLASPVGLPVVSNFISTNPASEVNSFLLEIGTTGGITHDELHEDGMIFNMDQIREETTRCGAMSSGGNYLDGTTAGSWSFEFLPCTNNGSGSLTEFPEKENIGFRCVVPVNDSDYN